MGDKKSDELWSIIIVKGYWKEDLSCLECNVQRQISVTNASVINIDNVNEDNPWPRKEKWDYGKDSSLKEAMETSTIMCDSVF